MWLAGEGVDTTLQYNLIILMLCGTGLKKWKKLNMSEEDRKDPVKVFRKVRESPGNDISFSLLEAHSTETSRKGLMNPCMS